MSFVYRFSVRPDALGGNEFWGIWCCIHCYVWVLFIGLVYMNEFWGIGGAAAPKLGILRRICCVWGFGLTLLCMMFHIFLCKMFRTLLCMMFWAHFVVYVVVIYCCVWCCIHCCVWWFIYFCVRCFVHCCVWCFGLFPQGAPMGWLRLVGSMKL